MLFSFLSYGNSIWSTSHAQIILYDNRIMSLDKQLELNMFLTSKLTWTLLLNVLSLNVEGTRQLRNVYTKLFLMRLIASLVKSLCMNNKIECKITLIPFFRVRRFNFRNFLRDQSSVISKFSIRSSQCIVYSLTGVWSFETFQSVSRNLTL